MRNKRRDIPILVPMLQVNFIRENFEKAVLGLKKRNFTEAETVLSQLVQLDDARKNIQLERDQLQAESNAISKTIGKLMQSGQTEEA